MKRSNTSILDKFITESVIFYRKKYGIKVHDIAEVIFSSTSFVQLVESGEKHYNSTHLFLIACLIKDYDPKFNFTEFYPNEQNYFTRLNFQKSRYKTIDILTEKIKEEVENKTLRRKRLQNQNMEE